jgi:hypothetical protein
MGVWQGVAMDSRTFHPALPCPTLLCPVAFYGRFTGGGEGGSLRPASTPLGTPRHTPMTVRRSPSAVRRPPFALHFAPETNFISFSLSVNFELESD